jgi:hypothetical protein
MLIFDAGFAVVSLLASLVEPFFVVVGWVIEFGAEHLFGVIVGALTDEDGKR